MARSSASKLYSWSGQNERNTRSPTARRISALVIRRCNAVAMISSKGAAGVTGAGFITLAATLSIVPSVPVAGMALILGIDRFMSECRSLTNFIGNAVATIFVAWWEGMLDLPKARAILDRPEGVEAAVLAEQGR